MFVRHAAILLSLALLPETAQAACAIDDATYRPVGHADHELVFTKARESGTMAGVDVELVWKTTGERRAFELVSSNGYMVQRLFPLDERYKETAYDIYFFNLRLEGEYLPAPGEPAPPYAFIPGLPLAVWYQDLGTLGRELVPMNIWQLACRR